MSYTYIKIKVKKCAKIQKCLEVIDQVKKSGIVEDIDIDICFKPEDKAIQMSLAKGNGSIYEIDRTLGKLI